MVAAWSAGERRRLGSVLVLPVASYLLQAHLGFAPLVGLLIATAANFVLELPVDTIGSRFGGIPRELPHIGLPTLSFSLLGKLIAPALTIALLGATGSGKTTTSAKIAKRLTERQNKKILMASLDTRRPAAQEQLRQLGEQVKVATLPIIAGQSPVEIARRAVQAAKLGGHDVVILDTAGRTHIDEPLMVEMADIKKVSAPHEILLVAEQALVHRR